MAVAVQADRLVGHLGEQGVEAFQQVAGDRLVGRQQAPGDEIAFQQGGQRGVAEVIHSERLAVLERPRGADRVQAAEQLAEAVELVEIARLGRPPAAPREQGEAEAGECEQAFAVARQRRHHRHLAFRQLGGEGVLLADRRVAPAVRSVELGDQRLAVLDADLVHAVFVAVERQHPCVAEIAEAFHGIQDEVGGQLVEGMGHDGASKARKTPSVRKPARAGRFTAACRAGPGLDRRRRSPSGPSSAPGWPGVRRTAARRG